ncbi:MAG: hypothetical protein ABWZ75_08345 [Novosphingobium sp.]
MKVVKRIFQVLAGLWLLGVLVVGIGGAWLTNNPEVVVDAVADVTGLEDAGAYRQIPSATREHKRAQERAADAGWCKDQSLSEDAKFESGGWGD